MEEIWKDIIEEGFEGKYEVSNLGRVRSWINSKGNRRKEPKILKYSLSRGGYLQVRLYKNGKVKRYYVHRLVYEAFIEDIPEGYEINHISECKTDNSLSNLNLLSHRANINWGTCPKRIAKTLSKSVIQKTLEGDVIKVWESATEVERKLGYKQGNICNCCRGGYFSNSRGKWINITQSYGYIWEYTEKAAS